jgi:hypothetical protein
MERVIKDVSSHKRRRKRMNKQQRTFCESVNKEKRNHEK